MHTVYHDWQQLASGQAADQHRQGGTAAAKGRGGEPTRQGGAAAQRPPPRTPEPPPRRSRAAATEGARAQAGREPDAPSRTPQRAGGRHAADQHRAKPRAGTA